jgi:hypothetical protein
VDTNISEKHTVSIFQTSALKMEAVCFSETLVSSPHGVATQKTNIDIFTTIRTSDFNINIDQKLMCPILIPVRPGFLGPS